jgi:hypothetical protein
VTEKRFDSYEGGCPECGGMHNVLNVGRVHWAVCHDHKTKWSPGENLYSSWRDESEVRSWRST